MEKGNLSTTSGAAKKRKKQKLEAEKSKILKISNFFPAVTLDRIRNDNNDPVFPSTSCSEITDSATEERPDEDVHVQNMTTITLVSDQAQVSTSSTGSTSTSSTFKIESMDLNLDYPDPGSPDTAITKEATFYNKTETDSLFLSSLTKQTFPCDKANFKNQILSKKLKMFLLPMDPVNLI